MMNCCCCESQQEAWIREAAEGKPNRFRKDNPRVIDMLESFDCTPPYVDIERARYFTESMKQTEGQHLTLRWAKALMNVAQKMPVYIEDTQLIVGRLGTDKGRYGIVYPELDGDFYEGVLADFATRENPTGRARPTITPCSRTCRNSAATMPIPMPRASRPATSFPSLPRCVPACSGCWTSTKC